MSTGNSHTPILLKLQIQGFTSTIENPFMGLTCSMFITNSSSHCGTAYACNKEMAHLLPGDWQYPVIASRPKLLFKSVFRPMTTAAASLLPPPKPAAMGIFLLQNNFYSCLDACSRKKSLGCPVNNISLIFRKCGFRAG